jgi:outer membrane protein assembly factor BamA
MRRWGTWVLAGILSLGLPLDWAEARITYFALPEIIVDPDEGWTYGVLGIVLFSAEDKRIRRIIAPDVRYNEVYGVYPTFRYFGYPTPHQRFFLSAGKSTEIDEKFEGTYSGVDLFGGRVDVQVRIKRDLDSRERFYGIGNDTDDDDETNYTGDDYRGRLIVGVHLPDDLILSTGPRFSWMRVRRGGVDDLPYTGDYFSDDEAPGLDGETIVGYNLGLWYDTRDLPDAPTKGSLLGGNFEIVDKGIGSSTSYLRWLLEGRTFQPLRRDGKIVLAARAYAEYMHGGERAPFYELCSLGGQSSLRSSGSNRYRDRHRLGAQLELRANVYQREIFGVRAALELTPFLDLGKVFKDSQESPFRDLHAAPGIAFRIAVRPQVVAYVDLGVDGDGVSAFSGIDYPF